MEIESQVANAMRQLEKNIEKARKNPQAVLQGSFPGTSRNVTVWVDSLGRTERYRIAPNSVAEGDELQLIHAFDEATKKARQKAENLEFEEDGESPHESPAAWRPSNRAPENADWDEEPGTWLR
ncbi:hypothetical protein [Saccharopolyspora sp. NPDC049426]|uniref:hypothetical protein n=1 Tax=Saccharopolyspora sp. NPDC049426 TaxID=3155652 RepID=UPI0034120556